MGSKAMRIERHYTQPGVSPYDLIPFATTKSEIRNPDGSVVFSLQGVVCFDLFNAPIAHHYGAVSKGGCAGSVNHGDIINQQRCGLR